MDALKTRFRDLSLRIAKLRTMREQVHAEVFRRVEEDYEQRREKLQQELGEAGFPITETLERFDALEAEALETITVLEEFQLRYHIGEFSRGDYLYKVNEPFETLSTLRKESRDLYDTLGLSLDSELQRRIDSYTAEPEVAADSDLSSPDDEAEEDARATARVTRAQLDEATHEDPPAEEEPVEAPASDEAKEAETAGDDATWDFPNTWTLASESEEASQGNKSPIDLDSVLNSLADGDDLSVVSDRVTLPMQNEEQASAEPRDIDKEIAASTPSARRAVDLDDDEQSGESLLEALAGDSDEAEEEASQKDSDPEQFPDWALSTAHDMRTTSDGKIKLSTTVDKAFEGLEDDLNIDWRSEEEPLPKQRANKQDEKPPSDDLDITPLSSPQMAPPAEQVDEQEFRERRKRRLQSFADSEAFPRMDLDHRSKSRNLLGGTGPSTPPGYREVKAAAPEKPKLRDSPEGLELPMLRVINVKNEGYFFPLNEQVVSLGRLQDNDIVITDDNAVSRYHTQIEFKDGAYNVVDLKSSNGTQLNGVKINATTKLSGNDIVTVGRTTVIFITTEEDLQSYL